jgi:LCP family protein required for cell wall assembly
MKKVKKILTIVLIALIVIIVTFIGYTYYILSSINPNNNQNNEENTLPGREIDWNRKINILLIGIDQRYEEEMSRADTNLLLSIDPKNKKLVLISLPRDSLVTLPGYEGDEKLAHAHSYGGVPLLVKTIESILNIEIPYYIEVNFDGFKKMIDLIGGVTIDVEKDMDYESYLGDVRIHLKKGLQHLNGEKALEYVRFRMDETGDIGRMERQQKFIKAVIKQALTLSNTIKLQKALLELKNWVKTNLEPSQIIKIGLIVKNINEEDMISFTLPGTLGWKNHLSYYILDYDKINEIVDKYLKDE